MTDDHETRTAGPVSHAVAAWLADPDVIADPYQREHGRVWTRDRDVLPGVTLHPDRPVVACWGELTWTGLPQWDPVESELLWLVPVTEPGPVPAPRQIHSPTALAEQVLGRLDGQAGPAAVAEAVRAVVEPLVADFEQCLEQLQRVVREDRRHARDLSLWLARTLPGSRRRELGRAPFGRWLQRRARRAVPASGPS